MKLFVWFIAVIFLFTGCSQQHDHSIQKKTFENVSIYGSIPNKKAMLKVIVDQNSDGIFDVNEESHAFVYNNSASSYAISAIPLKNASKIKVELFLNEQLHTARTLNVTNELLRIDFNSGNVHKLHVDVTHINANKEITFLLRKVDGQYTILQEAEPTNNDLFSVHFKRSIIPSHVNNITAFFELEENLIDRQLDNEIYNIKTAINFYIKDDSGDYIDLQANNDECSIKYVLSHKDDDALISINGVQNNANINGTGCLSNLKKRSIILLGRKVDLNNKKNICVSFQSANSFTQSISNIMVNANGSIRDTRYTDEKGKTVLSIYSEPFEYIFSYVTNDISKDAISFKIKNSTLLGCDYSADITLDDSNKRPLNIQIDSTEVIGSGFVAVYNLDYSDYRLYPLNTLQNNILTVLVNKNEPYTVTYQEKEYLVAAQTSAIKMKHHNSAPYVYVYFSQEDNESIPKLNVIGLDEDSFGWLQASVVTENNETLVGENIFTNDDYYHWQFDIASVIISNRIFTINVNDNQENIPYQVVKQIQGTTITFSDDNNTIYNFSYPKPDIISTFSLENQIALGTTKNFVIHATDTANLSLNYQWYVNGVKKAQDSTFTYTFMNEGAVEIRCDVSNKLHTTTISKTTTVAYGAPIITTAFSLENQTSIGITKNFVIHAIDTADLPLNYQWYVNGVKKAKGSTFTYIFMEVGTFEIRCDVSNKLHTTTISKTTTVSYEAPIIQELNTLPTKLLFGNYEFYVEATDLLDDNLTYEWLINGEVVSTEKRFTKLFNKDGIVEITCNVSNDFLTTTVARQTEFYYPKPIITSPLRNMVLEMGTATTFIVKASHSLENDPLRYEWFVDETLVSSDEIYRYTQEDDNEHNLTCKISNKYKTAITSAKVGNVKPQNLMIQTYEGNQVLILEEGSLVEEINVTDTEVAIYATVKDHLDFAVVTTPKTVLSKELFYKLIAITSNDECAEVHDYIDLTIEDNDRVRHVDFNITQNKYDLNNDLQLNTNEVYNAGLDIFDKNNDGKISFEEMEVYDYYEKRSNPFDILDIQFNKDYPVASYTYKDDTYQPIIWKFGKSSNRNVDYTFYKCGVEKASLLVTITNAPQDLRYINQGTYVKNMRYSELERDKFISSEQTDGGLFNTTFQVYSYKKNENDLHDYHLMFVNEKKSLILEDINASTTTDITVDYSDFATALRANFYEETLLYVNGSVLNGHVWDDSSSIVSPDFKRQYFNKSKYQDSTELMSYLYQNVMYQSLESSKPEINYLNMIFSFKRDLIFINRNGEKILTEGTDGNYMLYNYAIKVNNFACFNLKIDTSIVRIIKTIKTLKGCLEYFPDSLCSRVNTYFNYGDNGDYSINDFEKIRGFYLKDFDLDERDKIIEYLKDNKLDDMPRKENTAPINLIF